MTRILTCVDSSAYAESVADHTAWLASGLDASVELLQVLGRREAEGADLSGRVLPEGQRQLLERLSGLDAERFKLLQQSARLSMASLRERMEARGVADVSVSLRTGDLMEELAEREAGADYIVIGKRGEAVDFAKLHLGSNLERIIRASTVPVLVAARAFEPVEKAIIALDGRTKSMKALDALARFPLAQQMQVEIVTAGADTEEARRRLTAAQALLGAGGISSTTHIEAGDPTTVISAAVERTGARLLIMGAYGHSRLRSMVLGSVTSELIRACKIPIMIYS